MTRVAVTSRFFNALPHLKDELLALYPDAKFNADTIKFTDDALIAFLDGYDAAVIGLERFSERVVSALPDLKVVSLCSAGVDHIDPAVLKKHGVKYHWVAGINKYVVAELTISLMINILRKVNLYNVGLRAGDWPAYRLGRQLTGRTVGIHGCGHIGQQVARLLTSFNVEILACDRVDYADFYAETGVTPVSPEELWQRSEVLTLHLPRNATTIGLYTARVLDQLRPGCVLVNTARGSIVDEAALKERLKDGRIAAAAFDVFDIEPVCDPELVNLDNFLSTPHIGASTPEAWEAMARSGIRGIAENEIPEPGLYPFD